MFLQPTPAPDSGLCWQNAWYWAATLSVVKYGPGELEQALEFLLFRAAFRNAVFKLFLWLALLRREGLVCSGNRELGQPH